MKGPRLLATVGVALVLATAAVGTPADADLWGHLTFGRDIVSTGKVIQEDAYSFTDDRPWVNHEWVAEVSFAEVYRLAGPTGLIFLKVLIIALLLALVWRHVRRLGVSARVSIALLTLAFAGTFWRTHTVRPQLFSVLFFAALLVGMTLADQGRRWRLALVPPLMALWVNVHGGWIVGLGVLGLWTTARIVDWRIPLKDRTLLAVIGLAAVGATLFNPYGVHMWTFLGDTVRLGRADIEEWGSVLTHPLALGVPWALVCVAGGLGVWRAGRQQRWDYVAIVTLLAFASFRVSRLDAFFTLAVVILLAPAVGSYLATLLDRTRAIAGAGTGHGSVPPTVGLPAVARSAEVGVMAITVITVLVMLVPTARIIGPYASCLTIAGPWVPDADAARFIQLNRLKGRMLTWFDWGQYAIWHFGPDLQVSMDGRRETVYSDATIQAHRRFYAADETAFSYLRTLDPDFIWLPTHLPVTKTLGESGWRPIFTGPVSHVYAREGSGPFQQVGQSATGIRCFPGP